MVHTSFLIPTCTVVCIVCTVYHTVAVLSVYMRGGVKKRLSEMWTKQKSSRGRLSELYCSGETALSVFQRGLGSLPSAANLCFRFARTTTVLCVIIVSPLVSLMEDQVSKLKRAGIKSCQI